MFRLFSNVLTFGCGGLSFSWPGCDLMWAQYCEGVIGLLQIGQFWWSHLWLPMKLGWIVKLHLSHLFFSKIVLDIVLSRTIKMYWYLLSLNQYNSELANKYDNDLFIADVHNVCSSQNILAFSDFLNELIISFIIRNS